MRSEGFWPRFYVLLYVCIAWRPVVAGGCKNFGPHFRYILTYLGHTDYTIALSFLRP